MIKKTLNFGASPHYSQDLPLSYHPADAIKARERAEDMFRDFLRGLREEVPERDA